MWWCGQEMGKARARVGRACHKLAHHWRLAKLDDACWAHPIAIRVAPARRVCLSSYRNGWWAPVSCATPIALIRILLAMAISNSPAHASRGPGVAAVQTRLCSARACPANPPSLQQRRRLTLTCRFFDFSPRCAPASAQYSWELYHLSLPQSARYTFPFLG